MRDHPEAVMLFAAGFGTRMKHLTKDRAKPMIPVAGRPLVDHALDLARGVSPARIVANLHYLPETIRPHLEAEGVACIVEAPEILETGGGLRNALPVLGAKPVFTLNTDAVWVGPNPLTLLAEAWDPVEMDALLIGIPPAQASGRSGDGDFDLTPAGVLSWGKDYVFGGAQIIKTELLVEIEEDAFSLHLLWKRMMARQRMFGLPYPGAWCDVGHPDGIGAAETLLSHADV
jgi:N-acetyl-alpha-D-muramate 1-phosphate uridylyltransferase